jgi:Domain of unknown function (DUF5916)/Carbohydrate family 9 binding domain-like
LRKAMTVAGLLLVGRVEAALAADAATEAALRPRVLRATRVTSAVPAIDGRLDDPAWSEAEVATDFVQTRPAPGSLASVRTEARILYDEHALYVGVRAFDPTPATILAPWPRRDDEITSDWLFVELDSRHDRRSAFSFGVNPRGVQVDGVFVADVQYDPTWDAVWRAVARIDDAGWTAEFRIPFSQLSYSAGAEADHQRLAGTEADHERLVEAVWGVNVYRYTPRRGESSNWSPRLPSVAGVVSRFNELHLRVPAHTGRLQMAPYVAARSTRVPGENPLAEGQSLDGGGDLEAGLGSAFTLSAAVRPDFSQVEADPSEVNLTSFETFFTEKRPLFVDAGGLFHFDSSLPFVTRGNSFAFDQPFYSRRIGGAPHLGLPDGVRFGDLPETASLLGAVKLTGRTSRGWSVGGLGAVTGEATADFVNGRGDPGTRPVEPRTLFGTTRVARDFRGGASAVGAIATVVERAAMDAPLAALLPERAWAVGVDARHRFGGDAYELRGFLLGSRLLGSSEALARVFHGPGHYTQRPDAPRLEDDAQGGVASGFGGQVRLDRIGGEHWRWTLAAHSLSPRLETNDLGFQRNADWLVALGAIRYQQDHPGRRFRRWSIGSNQIGGGWSFGGERRAAVVNANASVDLHNYWSGALSLDHELPALQVEALRGGPALLMPARDAATLTVSSDSRRSSQWLFAGKAFRDHALGSGGISLAPSAAVRVSDRFAFSLGPSFERTVNAWQFVVRDPGAEGRSIVGRLDQTSLSLIGRFDLAFSNALTLQLYAQPFVSRGRFDRYQRVVAPRAPRVQDRVSEVALGSLPVTDPSFSVADLQVNLVLRWEYRPGSRLYVVWTQSRHHRQADASLRFPRDAFDGLGVAPTNALLVKLSYWLGR